MFSALFTAALPPSLVKLRNAKVRSAAWFLFLLLTPGGLSASNVIQAENAKPGTREWQLNNLAFQGEIEGYASATSVNRGGQISFYLNTAALSYTVEVFRLGWYGGLGGRRMTQAVQRNGVQQVIPPPDGATGLIECNWTDPYVLNIPATANDPTDWASGVYLVKLTASGSNKQRYIVFVVRDDASQSDYFFQAAVNTYQAYNNWGGKSLYDFNSIGGAAQKVSFNRPYTGGFGEDGAGDFVQGWEYNMVRFLEKEGFDVSYTTDVDVHSAPSLLLNHHAHLVVGHNEYWSDEMRKGLQSARDHGLGIGIFGGDTMFWQIRYEPSSTNQLGRTIVAYKDAALISDPYALDTDDSNDHLITTHWRDAPVNMPEDALIGVGFIAELIDSDIVISNPAHWVFDTTNLSAGDHLPGLLGYEVDGSLGHAPAGTTVLAHSPFDSGGQSGFSDMTVYTAPAGNIVFAAGSIQWSWGLDDFNVPDVHPLRVLPAAQQITRNVLARLIGNLPPVANSGGPYSGPGKVPLQFDGGLSSDPDGTVVDYLWDFGDGTSGEGQSIQHVYQTGGSYVVQLLVRDNRGSTNASVTTATIAPPDQRMSLSTTSLDFAGQLVGIASGPRQVVLKTIGSAPIDIASINVAEDFFQQNDCPSTLAPGGQCTVSVKFLPLAEGPRTGSLTIASTATGSPQTVTLSGVGTVPRMSLSVSTVNFGGQNVGTLSTAASVVLTSSGSAPVDFAGIPLTGDFQQEGNCPPTLEPGSKCTVTVRFLPPAEGPRTGLLTIASTATESPQTVALGGVGTVPHISISVSTLSFGLQPVHHAGVPQIVTVNNTGTGPLMFSGIQASPDFAVANSCPIALPAGGNCAIQVAFIPLQVGSLSGALSIQSNDNQGIQLVQLSGTAWDLSISLSRPSRPTRSVAGTATSFAVALRAEGANIPAQISCEAPANFSCSVDQISVFLNQTPTIIQVHAAASRALRLNLKRVVSGTITVRMSAGPVSRTIQFPVAFH
ncbi:MAG: hypothetical protein JWO20_2980 [Candidatus Angelobacter sp.]|nr:hypothetical protein [Candidatus Angelobacter sp.]